MVCRNRLFPEHVDGCTCDLAALKRFYNILLGIDGQMPIGSLGERSYRLLAPDSTVIANASGTLAEAAYEAFYGEGEEG